MTKNILHPKNKQELQEIIQNEIAVHGYNCDLNHVDVSNITDMIGLFNNSEFNGDISQWNVSNVNKMSNMFACSKFNGDISKWDVSQVTDMDGMFSSSSFSQNLTEWRPHKLNLMGIYEMLKDCSAPVPYWIAYGDVEERNIAIKERDIIVMHDKLSNELTEGSNIDGKLIKKAKI